MDILTWLDGTQFWHWWILAALIFAGIEILAPGVFFIWLGAAAALTGLIALVIPGMGWEIEALICSRCWRWLSCCRLAHLYQKKAKAKDELPPTMLNRRGDQIDRPHRGAERADPERPRQDRRSTTARVARRRRATCRPEHR